MQQVVDDIAEAIRAIDQCGTAYKRFHPGAGPYGEPQLVKLISKQLAAEHGQRYPGLRTCRVPDLLVPGVWALEFKIVRPYGDNGIEAEHWSQNLLHPYPGNVSALADVMKLTAYAGEERRGVVVIGSEHQAARVDLEVLVAAFELISRDLLELPLGKRACVVVEDCIHPVHQRARIYGWEVASSPNSASA